MLSAQLKAVIGQFVTSCYLDQLLQTFASEEKKGRETTPLACDEM
jgi:hypothetical protein